MKKDNLPELLSPKVDIIFKLLFGDERNKDLTISFISAVLGYKDGRIGRHFLLRYTPETTRH